MTKEQREARDRCKHFGHPWVVVDRFHKRCLVCFKVKHRDDSYKEDES